MEVSYHGFYDITASDLSSAWNSTNTFPTWTKNASNNNILTNVNDGFDKEMIVVDNYVNSPYLNNMYCVGTKLTSGACGSTAGDIRLFGTTTTSNINGSAFTTLNSDLRNGSGTGFGFGANVQTGLNGEIFVCWADYPSGVFPASNIGFACSADGGATWPVQTNAAISGYTGGVTTNCPQSNFPLGSPGFQSPPLFGVAWQNNGSGYNVNVDGTGYIRMTDAPTMAVDKSCGPCRGRVYIAWPEIDTNGNSAIALSYLDYGSSSTPYTGTWSTPQIISIAPGSANNPGGGAYHLATHSFFPAIAVDDITGMVSVAYHCMDGTDPNHTHSTNTYVAYSSDCASAFSTILVSDIPHLTGTVPGYDSYAGDYIGIAAHNGKAFAAWSDNRIKIPANQSSTGYVSSLWQIYVSEIDYSGMLFYSTTPYVLYVNGTVPAGGSQNTYQAVDEVFVAGNSTTFQNTSVSHVDVRACKEVDLEDGFGGTNEFHAYLYCPDSCYIYNPGGTERLLNSDNSSANSQSTALSQDHLDLETKVGIFPNPSTGILYLSIGAKKPEMLNIIVMDVNGRILISKVLETEIGANSHTLDLSNYPNGIYSIRFIDQKGICVRGDRVILNK